MNRLIKNIIFNVLNEIGYKYGVEDIEVTCPPKHHGDFSTNILLKNRQIDKDRFIAQLTQQALIEKVACIKGFINIYIRTMKFDVPDISLNRVKLLNQYAARRMKNISNRLESEDYICTTAEYLNVDYMNVLKAYNYVIAYIHVFNKVEYELMDAIFKAFEIFDENIVYRKLSYSELSEIKDLFFSITLLIERTTYE